MNLWARVRAWLRALVRRSQVEREMGAELQFHVESYAEDLFRSGVPRAAAIRRARLEFGGMEQTKEMCREARSANGFESLIRDVRYAMRTLHKSPSFTAIAVLSLALGIGANTAIFSLINALLLRALPVLRPQELVLLLPARPDGTVLFSFPLFRELERNQRVFSGVIAWSPASMANVEVNGVLGQGNVQCVTSNYYSVLGARPLLGRLLVPADANPDSTSSSQVAVLGYDYWRSHFGESAKVIGKQLRIEGQSFTIVGVTRQWFGGMNAVEPPEIMIPITAEPLIQGNSNILHSIEDRSILWLYVAGRLKGNVALAQAQAQVSSVWPAMLAATAPTQTPGTRLERWRSMKLEITSAATGIAPDLRGQFTHPLYILLCVVGLILLIACVNLACLMLARAAARYHEMRVRLALGANRWTIVRQVLTESLLLSFGGALLGLAFACWGSTLLVEIMTRYYSVPVVINLRPDLRVVGITLVVAMAAGSLFGLAPALRASRGDTSLVLQEHSHNLAGGAGRFSKVLLVTQIALAFVLLLGAGLLVRTFRNLYKMSLGFDQDSLLEFTLKPRPNGYRKLDMPIYRQQLIERISAIPGVRSASFGDAQIPSPTGWRDVVSPLSSDPSGGAGPMANGTIVTPQFPETLGISMVQGRDFDRRDDEHHPFVAMVSRSLGQRLFPDQQIIGQHIRFGVFPEMQSLEIVGVTENARLFDLRERTSYVLYLPSLQHLQWAGWQNLFVRANGASAGTLPHAVTEAIESLGHEYVLQTRSVGQVTSELLIAERVTAVLSSAFAGLALLLVGIGLYGLMSYTVTRRTSEIGIRTALGAQRRNIQWLILGEAGKLLLLGIIAGVLCSLAANRLIASMLFGVSSTDIHAILYAALLLLVIGLVGGYLPARRATRVDPMVALRYE